MSACISPEGEYGDHAHGGSDFVCSRCFMFDQPGALDALADARRGTAQARKAEREAIAAYLSIEAHSYVNRDGDALTAEECSGSFSALIIAANAIRNGGHAKEQS